jgi:hypothetical protein
MIYTKDYTSHCHINAVATFNIATNSNSLDLWSKTAKNIIYFDVVYKNIYLLQKCEEIYNFLSQYKNYFSSDYLGESISYTTSNFNKQYQDNFSKCLVDIIILRIYFEKNYNITPLRI